MVETEIAKLTAKRMIFEQSSLFDFYCTYIIVNLCTMYFVQSLHTCYSYYIAADTIVKPYHLYTLNYNY